MKCERNRTLTRTFERPGLYQARECNAVLIFCDFEPVTCRVSSLMLLGLSDLIPFVFVWRLFAFGLPAL